VGTGKGASKSRKKVNYVLQDQRSEEKTPVKQGRSCGANTALGGSQKKARWDSKKWNRDPLRLAVERRKEGEQL